MKSTETLLGKGTLFIFNLIVGNIITLGKGKSSMKHSAACKPTERKKRGRKKRKKEEERGTRETIV